MLSTNNATMVRARAAVVTAMADLSISAPSRSAKQSMVRTVNTMSVYIGVVCVCRAVAAIVRKRMMSVGTMMRTRFNATRECNENETE